MQYDECREMLESLTGTTFVGLDTVTVPKLTGGKKNPFQGRIEKVCLRHLVILFGSPGYEAKVRRHLEREGKNPDSFQAGPLPWGEHIAGTPFLHHKGEHYLQTVFIRSGAVGYRATDSIVVDGRLRYVRGDLLLADWIEGLPQRNGAEHQGLDSPVIVRAYKLDSIVGLRAFGEEYAKA